MDGFDGLMADLDAEFASAVARQEDEAADDLALSLRNDSTLVEALAGCSASFHVDGHVLPVWRIGPDHVETDDGALHRSSSGYFTLAPGPAPEQDPRSLLEKVRTWARVGGEVAVVTVAGQEIRGRLANAAADHLVLSRPGSELVLPIDSVVRIRVVHGDSEDSSHDLCAGRGDMGRRARSARAYRFVCVVNRLRRRRLLNERGSAAVEATFSIVLLMVIVLGAIEVAFALYAKNVVAASAHEAARAAIEVGRSRDEAEAVARNTVERAAGGLVQGLDVTIATSTNGTTKAIAVRVTGATVPFGPVPLSIPLVTTAHSFAAAR